MMALKSGRIRGGRPTQRPQRKEAEEIKLDFDAPLETNLNEILQNIVKNTQASRPYLLPLVKLAPTILDSFHRRDNRLGSWTLVNIYRCIRLLLVAEETEMRAEALRALRHLTGSELTFEVLCEALIPSLVVKSLDIVLDNKVERLQALRLMRRCAAVAPMKFPLEFVHCILAVASDGPQERDNFAKACLATSAELCITNPRLWISSGTFMIIVRSVLTTNVNEARAAESLISTLMYLVNDPQTRHLVNADLVLEYLISPFTDRNFMVHPDDELHQHEREVKARIALCSVLRSWPGLIYLCSEQSGLTKLIELLRLSDADTQRAVMGLFFDLFCLQTPEWTTDFRIALLASDDKTGLQRGWLLFEGFVAAEGLDLIPPIAKSVNLSACYMGILLQAMVMHGLLDAVAQATVGNDVQVSIHATVLLAELLHICNRYFPFDASHMCHLLPGLIDATMSPVMDIRLKAITVINRLAYIEQFKCETIGVANSLNLDQQLKFCSEARSGRLIESTKSPLTSTPVKAGSLKTKKKTKRKSNSQTSSLDNQFLNSGVFSGDEHHDWDVIKCLLKTPEFEEDPQAVKFLEHLVAFYLPSNRRFSAIETEREQARSMCSTLLVLADFLLEKMPTSGLLTDIMNDVCSCLQQIQGENIPPNSVLSPAKASSTLSQAYFLLIGRLTGSSLGLHVLKRATIFEQLTKLLTETPSASSLNYNDVYIKLALSPLNYANPGPSRELFKSVMSRVDRENRNETSKLYCVNLLRMLLRCRVADLSRWAIELLVDCLNDQSPAIKYTSYEVLNEACDVGENLDSLIAIDPDLNTTIEDQAWRLQVRYFSRLEGIVLLERKGTFESELRRWVTLGSLKYVKWVEDTINQSVSRHRRNPDGKYGRRYGGEHKLHRLRPAFCPPHLLGQLASHDRGIEIIKENNLVEPLCETIQHAHLDTPTCVFYVKAALWGIGHLCKSAQGLKLAEAYNVIPKIVELAGKADVLGVRGTAFYCLCLVSVTSEGCDVLSGLGWEGVRQCLSRGDRYFKRRAESVDSEWSLDSSWTSIHEFRDRAGSTRDSISFDDISTTSEDLMHTHITSPQSNWSFTDMRKMMHCYTSQTDAAGYGTLKLLRPKRRYRSTEQPAAVAASPEPPVKEESFSIPSVLIGLVLPRHISSIFNRNFLQRPKPDTAGAEAAKETFGAVHKKSTCFRCGDWDDEKIPERLQREFGGPLQKITAQDRVQVRNDLLKYVINLAAVYPNTNNKAIEQLLLSMKQKQPWVFSDLCLYSDLCHLLRIFQLKQPFRKFLQELFMDVEFSEFRLRAEDVIKKSPTMTIITTAETIKEEESEHRTDPETTMDESQTGKEATSSHAEPPESVDGNGLVEAPVTKSVSEGETTRPLSEAKTTQPALNVETAQPAPEVETTQTAPELETTQPAPEGATMQTIPEVETTDPVAEVETTDPVPTVETTNPIEPRTTSAQRSRSSDRQATEGPANEAGGASAPEASPTRDDSQKEDSFSSSKASPDLQEVNGDATENAGKRRRRRRKSVKTAAE